MSSYMYPSIMFTLVAPNEDILLLMLEKNAEA